MAKNRFVLPGIVSAQFMGTSVWFATNAVMPQMMVDFDLAATDLSHLTSAIQFGFIIGTLCFAIFNVADRFSPVKVFLVCALLASLFNLSLIIHSNTFLSLLSSRFLTGLCLAGIYPVGMKIASDHYHKGLGKSLGFLVGALVLGTAFPHFLNVFQGVIEWKQLISVTSGLAALGGLIIFFLVGDGPYRKASTTFRISAIREIFQPKEFKIAAFGYFGHMWELYTFWAVVPLILAKFLAKHPYLEWNLSLLSFSIIGVGTIGCILSGYLTQTFSPKKIAFTALTISAICCLLAPFLFELGMPILFLIVLLIWGLSVVADSPVFSTLVASNSQAELRGTALTIVNSIGFAITIVSIQFIYVLSAYLSLETLLALLAVGPILGLFYYKRH